MITKSVSCFARNTVGSLSAIQTLKEGDITCLSPAKMGIGKVDKDMALFYEDKKEKEEK